MLLVDQYGKAPLAAELAQLKPGQKKVLPKPHGSGDALLLAELADSMQLSAKPAALLTVVCADPADAERLSAEILWFAPQLKVVVFPDWETLPYDQFSPHQDLISERLAALHTLVGGDCSILLIPATTALYRQAPPSFHAAFTFFFKVGDRLNADALKAQLVLAGYSAVQQVVAPGEFAVRGGLFDLFPMGSPVPYRLDLFGDELDSIKVFDPDTQRTIYPTQEVRLLPAREFPLDEAGRAKFRSRFREVFEGDPAKSRLYKDISQGLIPSGVEYYLPLFFDQTATLFDYLPASTQVVLHGAVSQAVQGFWQDTQSRYNLLRGDRDQPLLPPNDLFLSEDTFFAQLKRFVRLDLAAPESAPESLLDRAQPTTLPPKVAVDRRAEDPVAALRALMRGSADRVLLLGESLGRREILLQYFAEYHLKPSLTTDWADFLEQTSSFMLAQAPVQQGFSIQGPGASWIHVLTESELYGVNARYAGRGRRAGRWGSENRHKALTDHVLRDLSEVKIGDPVVHEQHGIGRYLGLVSLDLGEGSTEFLELEYANATKLYVPVSSLHLISRYSGASPEAAPIHTLGSGQWEKAKRKAAQQVRDTAAELLNLYAQRAARTGYAFQLQPKDYEAFTAAFPFETTPDQQSAIDAVVADLTAAKPMDRLVCGDVGFGKTEVALRAAFVALMDNKQVAVLVPTTLLAEQHYQTFADRLADWPIKIAELSRFRSAKEIKQALADLADGKVDLVIGTHRLIQPDVQFKRLGLVIIDEEHRFGVRQKEQLKKLRAEVDVLTLTATPIPRSLAMALEGLRDFSVITTAPQRRLAIKTFVTKFSDGIIREAVIRELKRGGQVYFLHNEIETIENMREKLVNLLPEARIRIGHGQMSERELEEVMRDFYQQRCNLLLCSTIIETGIDVPHANTILINRADKFGLAQLHQLRGRVGRSHHQAYAYLLTPGEDALTTQAKKRLEAIQLMEDLGSGFYLAMHDLEIRGAGEVLGDSQSGEMQEVGFTLYTEMLNHAVDALKAGREPDLNQPLGVTTEINLHIPALLPTEYCPDVHERLVLYKRFASCQNDSELEGLHEELIDRFGLLPEPAEALMLSHRLRLTAKALGVTKVDASAERILLHFVEKPPFEPMRLIQMLQKDRRYQFAGPNRLKVEQSIPQVAERVRLIQIFLKGLLDS